jgi:hypothetical protein
MGHLGAFGGRAFARNQRLRRLALLPSPTQSSAAIAEPRSETAAQAIATLDAQFPWLRGAEKRHPRARCLSVLGQPRDERRGRGRTALSPPAKHPFQELAGSAPKLARR